MTTLDTVARQLRDRIREQLDPTGEMSDESLLRTIEEAVYRYSSSGHVLTANEKETVIRRIFHSFRGLDILQPLLEDPSITEIMINAHDEIFIERDGKTTRYAGRFESREKLEDVIQAIVAKVNRAVNEASPIVDARLADGSRVNVVLPPVALKGPAVTIRKFPARPLTMADLIERGTIDLRAASFLEKLVRAKYNIFIGGGTGSGKTTFLNALCQYVSDDERIVTIEDSAELQIRGVPNWVRLETRNANTEGKGAITIRDLIKSSLRMRPDRIIVGEVRGAEAIDMLTAMNTGHDGSLSTGHANSVRDMLSRLETMVLSGSPLPVDAIRRLIASAVDVMIHLARFRDRSRKVVEITELVGVEQGEIVLNPLFRFVEEGETADGKIKGSLRPTGNAMRKTHKFAIAGIPYDSS